MVQRLRESQSCGSLLNYSIEAVHSKDMKGAEGKRLSKQLACAHKVNEILASIQIASTAGVKLNSVTDSTVIKPTVVAIKC